MARGSPRPESKFVGVSARSDGRGPARPCNLKTSLGIGLGRPSACLLRTLSLTLKTESWMTSCCRPVCPTRLRTTLELAKKAPEQVGTDPIRIRYLRRFDPTEGQNIQSDRHLAELLAQSGGQLQEQPVPLTLGAAGGGEQLRGELRRLSRDNAARRSTLMTELGVLANVLKAVSRGATSPLSLVGLSTKCSRLPKQGSRTVTGSRLRGCFSALPGVGSAALCRNEKGPVATLLRDRAGLLL